MRVVVVVRPDFRDVTGGDNVQVNNTVEGLRKHGVDAHVFTADDPSLPDDADLFHCFHLPGVPLALVDRFLSRGRPVAVSPVFWDTTPLWFQDLLGRTGKWAAIARVIGDRTARALYVRWQHAKRARTPRWREHRAILQAASVVLPNARAETAHLAWYFRISLASLEARSRVVVNGIDPALFEEATAAGNHFRASHNLRDFVLEVGRIEAAKGQLDLIRAMEGVRIPLVFVGQPSPYEPEYLAACQEAARRRGDTYFLGKFPQPTLVGAYAAAATHALPSWRETPGLVSLEAAAAGTRVVSTSEGTAAEYFEQDAHYCRPGDARSIRAAVEAALATPVPPRLGDRVRSTYTWDAAAAATFDAYQELVR